MRKGIWSIKRSELTPEELEWVREESAAYARRWRKIHGHRVNAELRRRYRLDEAYNEKVRLSCSRWHKNNFEKVLLRKKRNYHAKDKFNIQHVLKNRISRRIRLALNKSGASSNARTLEYCGCNVSELMTHLQSKFLKGMHWNNYGKWHIDHIRPCASFDLTDPEQQKQCFHYTNLQPLWAAENLSKGAKVITTHETYA